MRKRVKFKIKRRLPKKPLFSAVAEIDRDEVWTIYFALGELARLPEDQKTYDPSWLERAASLLPAFSDMKDQLDKEYRDAR